MKWFVFFVSCGGLLSVILAERGRHYHPDLRDRSAPIVNEKQIDPAELDTSFWINKAQEFLQAKVASEKEYLNKRAKNVIMFLGDGMSLQTVAATRVFVGGENKYLSFENFPYTGLAKTYCVNRQVADSACTSTAYLNGVKGNYGTVGVTAQVPRYDCTESQKEEHQTESIGLWAQNANKATGVVTTSRITHASPAGLYAHSANRYWEGEIEDDCDRSNYPIDIGIQLVHGKVGKNLKVVLGGGRRELLSSNITDEEGYKGLRKDDRNLIDEWLTDRKSRGKASYVWNEEQLKNVDITSTDYLLGLFEPDHCKYNLEIAHNQEEDKEPSLTEMTETAIRMLSKEKNGYFLFVEGARIDMAHHDTLVQHSLGETEEFSNAIQMAYSMTDPEETLIVVTSDHGHTLSYNGYSPRGSDILGVSREKFDDGIPLTILSYANGEGYHNTYKPEGGRIDFSKFDLQDLMLEYPSLFPRNSETHGADDVGVYANGPCSHLFMGVYEQNSIALMMARAAGIGPYQNDDEYCNTATSIQVSLTVILAMLIIKLVLN